MADNGIYDFEKRLIGCSDIARIVYVSYDKLGFIDYGGDGSYYARIITGECEMPERYELVASGEAWLKIYDDRGLRFFRYADSWEIYRAGNFGTIIKLIGGDKQ